MLGVFVVYLVCGWLGIKYGTMQGTSLSLLWLPSGISLAVCVRYGAAAWPVIWLGSFVTNTPFLIDPVAAAPWLKAIAFGMAAATCNTLIQALLAHALFRRSIQGDIRSTQNILNFLIKVTLLPSMLNMAFLTGLYGWGGYIAHESFVDLASVWLAGTMADYHGYFVAGLSGIAWMSHRAGEAQRFRHDRWSVLVLLAFIGLVLAGVLWNSAAMYLITMVGVLVAMYWGLRESACFVLCISLALTVATANQAGPFVSSDSIGTIIALLTFVFSLGVPIYLLAVNRHELLQSQRHLEARVRERTRELHAANERLELLSNNDELTGLANRRHFNQVLASEWQRALRHGKPLAIAMIDVDWFKKYNDHYGHPAGDQCLRMVAETLAGTVCRAGDLVARYGGEEFVFLAPFTTEDNARSIAETFCQRLRLRQIPHQLSPFDVVTASVGVAAWVPDQARTPEALLAAADEALYCAKAAGRDGVVVSSGSMP